MKKPNLFILGAPKCGTTSLTSWLGGHPSVFISDPKEPWFFNTDLGPQRTSSRADYERLFLQADQSHQVVGEASTIYLRSREAVAGILEYAPGSRFVVILRNPVEMAISLHGQYLLSGSENLEDFEEAWRAQPDRASSSRLPSRCSAPRLLQYGWMCRLGEQLELLFKQVDRRRVLVLFLDEVSTGPEPVYRELLHFLGLPDDGRRSFPLLNPRKQNRLRSLNRAIRSLGAVKEAAGLKVHTGVLKGVVRWNSIPAPRPQLRPELIRELKDYFSEDVRRLEKLTGRNLQVWIH